ncbi:MULTISPECIES: hypothetical protein [Rhizobium]|uniref:Transcriptional regulator SbtR-like C-terminal domain-containing protein n=1 Tax=Rhizobium favelukesii TaxID=348824 RepID=W6RNJ6_9HYPH|nr:MULTISPECIES: hypothetical protein [Rhizobium]MCA0804569.1 TetR family transcriptional regulator [Rhizobium sp. T1473]MCS0463469.1 TetR family transcriptional regulator [Rhizobium favelukesii]UFS80047.1 TetR family transcriptional regulator [Rhizobium sp. T136]CDM61785.1 hypothetical protein LPU83_pLPU83d_0414 [Rhizobium favelukesii]
MAVLPTRRRHRLAEPARGMAIPFRALQARLLTGLGAEALRGIPPCADLILSAKGGSALESWFRDWVAFAQGHRGVVNLMAAAHTNPQSALYAACASVHSASARLLLRAQSDGSARHDMNGDDLFALMTALGWAIDQPSFAPPADQLVRLITDAVLAERQGATDAIDAPIRSRV